MQSPDCSILIANYNGANVIENCLRSIELQTGTSRIEVIVYDDASSDNSMELVRKNFPTVRCIDGRINAGYCIANNRMAQVAHGRFLLLLNNDATLEPDAIDVFMEWAQTCDSMRILTLPQYDMASGELIDVGRAVDPSLNPVPRTTLQTADVAMCIGACLWIPHELWNELDGFPEWFGSIGEDLFLCLTAWRAGYGVTALGKSGYHHHVGKSFGGGKPDSTARLSSPARRRQLSEINRTRSLAILIPPPLRWLLLGLHLTLLVIEGVLVSVIFRRRRLWSEIYWPALVTPYRDRSRIHTERQRVRRLTRAPISRLLSLFSWFPYKLRMLLHHGMPRITDS